MKLDRKEHIELRLQTCDSVELILANWLRIETRNRSRRFTETFHFLLAVRMHQKTRLFQVLCDIDSDLSLRIKSMHELCFFVEP
jgi:hypothetical protein